LAFRGLWRGHHVDTLPFLQEATGNTIFPPPRFRFRSKVILRFFASRCIHFGAAHLLSFSRDKVKSQKVPTAFVRTSTYKFFRWIRASIWDTRTSIECRVDSTWNRTRWQLCYLFQGWYSKKNISASMPPHELVGRHELFRSWGHTHACSCLSDGLCT
jgi:hypothetical protein